MRGNTIFTILVVIGFLAFCRKKLDIFIKVKHNKGSYAGLYNLKQLFMNYASLIALLAALAFSLPFLVKLAERVGISRGFGMMVTLAAGFFILAWLLLRERIKRQELLQEQIATIKQQINSNPNDPAAYYFSHKHLGDLYILLGNKLAALDAFTAYRKITLANQVDVDMEKTDLIIEELKQQISNEHKENEHASL